MNINKQPPTVIDTPSSVNSFTDDSQVLINRIVTDNIDIWTSAIKKRSATGRGSNKKIELTGIKKLREFILELAVRGKLVPQDPNDEPASVLLEKITAEKAQLIKDKKIKKTKALPEIGENEKPFELPDDWEWIRLGNYAHIFSGNAFKSTDFSIEIGIKSIKITNAGVGELIETDHYLPLDYLEKFQAFKVVKDDLLLALTRPYISGGLKVSICPQSYHNSLLNQRVAAIRPYSNPAYVYLNLRSPYVLNTYKNKFGGNGLQPNLKMSDVTELVLALPPLAEQHRIVAKVDELMLLCDQLEQQTEDSITAHQTLVETLLATLSNSESPTAFNQNWTRIAAHFDTLFTTEHSIDQLKQTILQLAVMGKLVPQDSTDQPASVLLEKIAAEKEQLIKDKKIKKQKLLPAITEDEKQFELPNGWALVRLDDICFGITSGSTPPKEYFQKEPGVPYLKVYNIRNQKIDFEYKPQFVESTYHLSKLTRSILYPGDVVMNIVGPPLGKIAIIPSNYPEWNCNQAIVFFRSLEQKLNSYIYTYLTAGTFINAIELIGTAGQDNISVTKSRSIIFPMPPLSEQHRIVKKVHELIILCDQLKTRINDAQTTQLHLADAIVQQAVN